MEDGAEARRRRMGFALFLSLALLLTGLMPAQAERRVALVIGNAAYLKTTPLANPVNDATDLASKLTGLGFEVTLRLDATKPVLDRALLEFARSAATADVALFYFAGHGMQYEGRNYLLPVDAKIDDDLDIKFQLFALDDVRAALDRLTAARIIILDACRNNPIADQFARSALGATRDVGAVRGLARVPQGRGALVAFATQPDEGARDGGGRNSPFTKALLRHIGDEGAEIGSVFRRVAASVHQETSGRQTPEVMISLLRDVYLKPEPNDARAWKTVQLSRNPADLEDFLARYPRSVHREGARALLDYLRQSARLKPGQERSETAAEQELARRERELKERLQALEAEKSGLAANLAAKQDALHRAEQERRERERQFDQEMAQREARLRAEIERQSSAATAAERETLLVDALARARAELSRELAEAVRKSQAERDAAVREAREREEKLKADVARLQQELARAQVDGQRPVPSDKPNGTGEGAGPAGQAGVPQQIAKLDAGSEKGLTPRILEQLTRIGCYRGSKDASWATAAVQKSLKTFAARDRSTVPAQPSDLLLEVLSGKQTGFCDPVCSAGTSLRDGRCVAVRTTPIKREKTVDRPAPDRETTARCFVFNRQQYCQ